MSSKNAPHNGTWAEKGVAFNEVNLLSQSYQNLERMKKLFKKNGKRLTLGITIPD